MKRSDFARRVFRSLFLAVVLVGYAGLSGCRTVVEEGHPHHDDFHDFHDDHHERY